MNTTKTIFAGLFVAMGVLLPVAFHIIGISGRIFFPMHSPVLMNGLLLGPAYGLAVGIAVPVVSALMTGMPPMFPVLPMMTAELAVYGVVAGFIHQKMGRGLLTSLIGAMICGRIMDIMVLTLFGEVLKIDAEPFIYVMAGVWTGLPGIIIQVIFIPYLVRRLKEAFFDHKLFQEREL